MSYDRCAGSHPLCDLLVGGGHVWGVRVRGGGGGAEGGGRGGGRPRPASQPLPATRLPSRENAEVRFAECLCGGPGGGGGQGDVGLVWWAVVEYLSHCSPLQLRPRRRPLPCPVTGPPFQSYPQTAAKVGGCHPPPMRGTGSRGPQSPSVTDRWCTAVPSFCCPRSCQWSVPRA